MDGETNRLEAIARYEQAIAVSPTVLSNYWHLGLEWLLQGDVDQAQAVWFTAFSEATEEATDWLPELLQILWVAALRQFQERHFWTTEQICQQILELDANQVEALNLLGQAIAQRGEYDTAIACWQQAVELDPTLVEAYQQQGSVFQKLDQLEQAISCYSSVLTLQPDRAETHYHLGLCLFQQGKLDEAIAHFTTAIQLHSDYSQAYSDRGYAYLQQGHFDATIADFQQAIQLQHSFVQAYTDWQKALTQQNRSNERINANANLLQSLQSINFNTFFQLGNALVETYLFDTQAGRSELAIAAYQQAINLNPNIETYLKLGQILKIKGDRDQACTAFQSALQLQQSADAYLHLGEINLTQDVNQAILMLQTAIELDPNLAAAYLLLGEARLRLRQWHEAIDCYQKHLQLKPDSILGRYKLGFALAMQNEEAAAIECWQQAINQHPDYAAALMPSTLERLRYSGKELQHSLEQLEPVDAPAEFYESTQEWAIANAIETTNYIQLDVKNTIELIPPKTLEQAIHFSFRFEEAIELPGNFVATIPNGRFWLNEEQTSSAVIAGDGKLLADLSPDYPVLSPGHPDKHPSQHSLLKLEKLPPIQHIEGTVAVLSGLTNDLYFHWIFDILPRIELLRRGNINFEQIDRFLVSDRLPFQQETLKTLGIPAKKILRDTYKSHIQATNLIVPSYPGSVAWMPKWTCDFLRKNFLTAETVAEAGASDRLYITRQQTANRRIINEAAVVDLLTQFGFQIVTLEALSVAQQAAVLAKAKVVVSSHGGGLTNLVFCQPGTKVIELFSPNYVYPCYWLVSNLVELEYYYLTGKIPLGVNFHQLLYADSRVEDMFISLEKLTDILRLAGVI